MGEARGLYLFFTTEEFSKSETWDGLRREGGISKQAQSSRRLAHVSTPGPGLEYDTSDGRLCRDDLPIGVLAGRNK